MSDKLALLGGKPVRKEPFPWDKKLCNIGELEYENVKQVLESKRLSPFYKNPDGGYWVQRFERSFARIHEMSYAEKKRFYAISCDSGTAALHIAYAALGIGCGDEVIVPSYTFIATATAALHHNAIPIFADVNIGTYNIEPQHVEDLITERTKAITIVPILGNPCDMGAWTVWLEEYNKEHSRNIKLVEDTAQALGASYAVDEGIHYCGTFGDIAAFSFQHTKTITTGEGGMVLTSNKELAERCKLIRNHGETRVDPNLPRQYISHILGWNYRMRELDAAIGCAQLLQMPIFNDTQITNALDLEMGAFNEITLNWRLQERYDMANPIYSLFGTRLQGSNDAERASIIEALAAEGITATTGYPRPIYENPIFFHATAYGHGCPFRCWGVGGDSFEGGDEHYRDYIRNLVCPNTKKLCSEEAIWFDLHRYPAAHEDMEDIKTAIRKIDENIDELYTYQQEKEEKQ